MGRSGAKIKPDKGLVFVALLSLEAFGPDAAQQKYLGFVFAARHGAGNSGEPPQAGTAARARRRAVLRAGLRGTLCPPAAPHLADARPRPQPGWCWRDRERDRKAAPLQPLRLAGLPPLSLKHLLGATGQVLAANRRRQPSASCPRGFAWDQRSFGALGAHFFPFPPRSPRMACFCPCQVLSPALSFQQGYFCHLLLLLLSLSLL